MFSGENLIVIGLCIILLLSFLFGIAIGVITSRLIF